MATTTTRTANRTAAPNARRAAAPAPQPTAPARGPGRPARTAPAAAAPSVPAAPARTAAHVQAPAPVARPAVPGLRAPMARPPMPGARPAPAAPARSNGNPPAAPVDVKALQSELAKAKGELAKALDQIARLRPKTHRTIAEILDGATDSVKADDWRLAFHGVRLDLWAFVTDKRGVTIPEPRATVSVLLAIPRSNDVGNNGSAQRAGNAIALHFAELEGPRDENGNPPGYDGAPEYLTENELAIVGAGLNGWPELEAPAEETEEEQE